MHILLPLAHGALGYLDEILPFVLAGGLAALMIIVGFISRRREENDAQESTSHDMETPSHAADHYRLD